jgi:hypothetical protein
MPGKGTHENWCALQGGCVPARAVELLVPIPKRTGIPVLVLLCQRSSSSSVTTPLCAAHRQVLEPSVLAQLAGLVESAPPSTPGRGAPRAAANPAAEPTCPRYDAARLARYALRRSAVLAGLLAKLATVPEAIEMARATGLTLPQVSPFAKQQQCGRP